MYQLIVSELNLARLEDNFLTRTQDECHIPKMLLPANNI